MRSLRLALIVLPIAAILAGGSWLAYSVSQRTAAPTDPTKTPCKLVVLVVFDQMRGDYLARWANQFGPDGFERMKKHGVWYGDCHLPYACSSTGPGHASLVTGAPPSVHGIIENDWYDRGAAAKVYCVQPTRPYERVPPLPADAGQPARGAASGFSPERLLAETVGDRLQAATGGKGRVVSLSLKDRTTVLMGGKKPSAAYCFDTRDGVFHTVTYYRDEVHPWVAEFNASGRANAWVGKDWTRLHADRDYDRIVGRDDAAGEATGVGGADDFSQTRVFPHPFPSRTLREKKPKTYYACVETSPAGNDLLFDLAKAAILGENLGRGDAPDLLCVSFSSNDLIGHSWGPDSQEVLDATLRSDRLVADFLKYLDEKLPDRYAMVVTADHGVCPLPEQKRIATADRRPLGELYSGLAAALDDTFGIAPSGPTRWFEGEKFGDSLWPWIYLNRVAIEVRGLDFAAVAEYASQWVGNRPHMLAAFTRKRIETNSLPLVGMGSEAEVRAAFEKVKLAFHPDRCGDVIAVTQPGVLMTGYPAGTNHGSPHSYDTHVPVLMVGSGIPAQGKKEGRASSLIVAPSLARSLGIDPPAAAREHLP